MSYANKIAAISGAVVLLILGAWCAFYVLDLLYLTVPSDPHRGYWGVWRTAKSYADFMNSIGLCGSATDFWTRVGIVGVLMGFLVQSAHKVSLAFVLADSRLRAEQVWKL